MYSIAKYLNYLNKEGAVKSFSGNENGYAKVLEMTRGCCVWVHHMKNDHLTINLRITPAAESRYPLICENAVNKFRDFFHNQTPKDTWQHNIDSAYKAKRYSFDITDKSEDEIFELIGNLISVFSQSANQDRGNISPN